MIQMKWNQDKITELQSWVLTKKADTRKLLWTAGKTEEDSKSAETNRTRANLFFGRSERPKKYRHWPTFFGFVFRSHITVNPGHTWTIFLKFERSFEIYMSVLKIANEISEFPYKFP